MATDAKAHRSHNGNGKAGHNGHGLTRLVDVGEITVPAGGRTVGDISGLVGSIVDVGLLNPVTVSKDMRLIAGRRRLAAVKSIGWEKIRATIVELADLKAELAEIDENLIRNDLTVLERSEQVKRRKEIYEELHPAAKQGVAGGKARQGSATEIISFADETAEKAGVTARTVRQEVQIATSIFPETKALIQDTPLADNKSELLRLARVGDRTKQTAAATAIAKGQASTVSQAVRVVERVGKGEAMAKRAAAAGDRTTRDWSILTGDSLEHGPRLRDAGRRFRLIFADPPYNQGVDYGAGARADKLDPEAYLDWCGRWFEACAELLTDDGSLWVLISADYAADYAIGLRQTPGLHLRQWIIWYESFGVYASSGRRFSRCHRHLFHCVRDPKRFVFNAEAVNRPSDRQLKYQDKRADPNGKVWDDVWGINPPIPRLVDNAAERIPEFPTQLPLTLLRPIVGVASDAGDEVLDPFSGSATTGVASIELGRRYTGIEKSANYAGLSTLRLKAASAERKAS